MSCSWQLVLIEVLVSGLSIAKKCPRPMSKMKNRWHLLCFVADQTVVMLRLYATGSGTVCHVYILVDVSRVCDWVHVETGFNNYLGHMTV